MYFIYVSNDIDAVELLEQVLHRVDQSKILLAVPNGYDLIQFLQNVKRGEAYPDLIILTTHFARLGGKELLELLKTDDIYRMIPVLMFLSNDNKEDAAFCKRLGTDYLVTPTVKKDWIKAAKRMCTSCA